MNPSKQGLVPLTTGFMSSTKSAIDDSVSFLAPGLRGGGSAQINVLYIYIYIYIRLAIIHEVVYLQNLIKPSKLGLMPSPIDFLSSLKGAIDDF